MATPDRQNGQQATAALTEPPAPPEDFDGSTEELLAEIERLTEENRASRDHDRERRLLVLRHLAGVRFTAAATGSPEHAVAGQPPQASERLPDVDPEQLTPELLRAGILRDGAVLVRGLVPREDALRFASEIARCFEERDREEEEAGSAAPGYYEEFASVPNYKMPVRGWVKMGGGVLAFDSPALAFDMLEMFHKAGLPELVAGYLGEPGLLSLQKTTLRQAAPEVAGAWHQDGFFLGEVRALNLWLSLSRCGDESPGLDVVPRRLDELVDAGTEGAALDYTITQENAEAAAGDASIVRPIFEPGDALLFDDLFLHKTGSDPSMPKPRYAIESWFFGASGHPEEYAPFSV